MCVSCPCIQRNLLTGARLSIAVSCRSISVFKSCSSVETWFEQQPTGRWGERPTGKVHGQQQQWQWQLPRAPPAPEASLYLPQSMVSREADFVRWLWGGWSSGGHLGLLAWMSVWLEASVVCFTPSFKAPGSDSMRGPLSEWCTNMPEKSTRSSLARLSLTGAFCPVHFTLEVNSSPEDIWTVTDFRGAEAILPFWTVSPCSDLLAPNISSTLPASWPSDKLNPGPSTRQEGCLWDICREHLEAALLPLALLSPAVEFLGALFWGSILYFLNHHPFCRTSAHLSPHSLQAGYHLCWPFPLPTVVL